MLLNEINEQEQQEEKNLEDKSKDEIQKELDELKAKQQAEKDKDKKIEKKDLKDETLESVRKEIDAVKAKQEAAEKEKLIKEYNELIEKHNKDKSEGLKDKENKEYSYAVPEVANDEKLKKQFDEALLKVKERDKEIEEKSAL